MPSEQESKQAGNIDVADFGDKDLGGCYARGAVIELPDGRTVDAVDVPDVLGGRAPAALPPR